MSCVLCWSVNGDSNCKTDAVQKRSLSLKAIAENSLTPILQIRVGLIGVISSVVTAKPYKTPLNVKQYQGHVPQWGFPSSRMHRLPAKHDCRKPDWGLPKSSVSGLHAWTTPICRLHKCFHLDLIINKQKHARGPHPTRLVLYITCIILSKKLWRLKKRKHIKHTKKGKGRTLVKKKIATHWMLSMAVKRESNYLSLMTGNTILAIPKFKTTPANSSKSQ